MKKLLLAITLGLFTFSAHTAEVPALNYKLKRICDDVKGKDGKIVKNPNGSTKQTCRTIKVRKKAEGTPVPTIVPKK